MNTLCIAAKYVITSCTILSLILLSLPSSPRATERDYPKKRERMVKLIENDVRATTMYIGMTELRADVMQSMRTVKRHLFVPRSAIPFAYENRPLAIGHGQTISQPYIVALMTDLLEPDPTDMVLEIGTGSGYQAAILSSLVSKVFTMEIIEPLADQVKERFQKLQYTNIFSRTGDGYYGWKEHAPFDSIIVTAAASHVPPPLLQQLKPGGRMVIPVGSRFLTQQLLLIEKTESSQILTRQILPVRFVPLTGDH